VPSATKTPRRTRTVSFRVFAWDGTLLAEFTRPVAPRDPAKRFAAITRALTRSATPRATAAVAVDNGVKFYFVISRGVADVPMVRYLGGNFS
jgi:hypothetical protein